VKPRHLIHHGSALLFSSLGTIGIQLFALTTLETRDFGYFSATYLVVALFLSASFSILCEPWQRGNSSESWEVYGTVLTFIAVVATLVTSLVAWMVSRDVTLMIILALACGLTIFRAGSRYFSLVRRDLMRVNGGDIAFVISISGGWVITSIQVLPSSLTAFSSIWLIASAAAALWSQRPYFAFKSHLSSWKDSHSRVAAPLLVDSSLLDLAGIGVPFILIPILGIAGFGTYRGISNVSSPIKLLLAAVRPYFGRLHGRQMARFRTFALVVGLSCVPGAILFGFLSMISHLDRSIGALSAVSEYALQAGLVSAFTLVNGTYYILGRLQLSGRDILTGRTINLLVGIGLPLGGAVVWGVEGAIDGFTLAMGIFAVTWFWQVRTVARNTQKAQPTPSVSQELS
jgi:hypothetical protein